MLVLLNLAYNFCYGRFVSGGYFATEENIYKRKTKNTGLSKKVFGYILVVLFAIALMGKKGTGTTCLWQNPDLSPIDRGRLRQAGQSPFFLWFYPCACASGFCFEINLY